MKPARFWPLAALILLPVLVLAAVATFGLRERRKAVEDSARVEGERLAKRMVTLWEELITKAVRGDRITPYPLSPAPASPNAEALRLEEAIATKDASALFALRNLEEGQPLTASGLPVRVLAAWHLWQLFPNQANATSLAQLATGRDASILTGTLLTRLATDNTMQSWLMLWRNQERRLSALSRLEPGRTRGLLPDEHGAPVYVLTFAGSPESSVLLTEKLQELADELTNLLRDETPPWATVSVRARNREFSFDTFYEMAGWRNWEDFQLIIYIKNPTLLMADYHRMVKWVWMLTGTALFTSLVGLALVHHTLTKERRLGELKSQFVSSVSHELRAPVGSLRLMADGLASGKVTGAAADEFHRLMAGEGARLSSLIENVLDFARIEQGRKEYHMAETDIAALVQDAVKLMTPQAEARGLRIVCELEPLPFVPKVDAGALQQALINLLDNAIKFTPANVARLSKVESAPDSTLECRATILVTLAAEPSRNSWSLTVTDHGPGIPAAEHARIFERFYRLGNELRRETTGTGIGLAIVKHIVEGHGGRVGVESELGKGSTFRIEFPSVASVLSVP